MGQDGSVVAHPVSNIRHGVESCHIFPVKLVIQMLGSGFESCHISSNKLCKQKVNRVFFQYVQIFFNDFYLPANMTLPSWLSTRA